MHKVFLDEIIAFEAKRNYVMLHLKGRRIMTYLSISDVPEQIPSIEQFVRLHRAFIIAVRHIKQIKRGQVTMENGLSFMVGDHYRDVYNPSYLLISSRVVGRKKKINQPLV
ncbi:DNA-binding LytR/AlgR family response regulator [Pedobacter sp. UYP24]